VFACLYASSFGDALAALAAEFSPLVEKTALDTVIFSIVGLERLIGAPQQIGAEVARRGSGMGIHASLAIAHNPDSARLAARHLPGITIIPLGKEADRLGGIPVTALNATPELIETLDRWGIRTLADLAALPEIGIAERLGEEGVRLRKLALGRTRRPLKIAAPPQDFEQRTELEHPIALIEPLLFLFASMLGELTGKLEEQSLAANRVHLALELDNKSEHHRTLEFPVPVRDSKILLKHLQLDLEAHPPAAAIVAIRMRLDPAKPRVLQNGLFVPAAPAPDKLQVVLARVAGLVGEGHVGSPEVLNTHRPDAFRIREFSREFSMGQRSAPRETHTHIPLRLAFRVFRPSLVAKVRVEQDQPAQVTAHGVRGNVLAAAGPWRSAGEWWTDTCWARDEWDLSLSDGALYRLYWDLRTGGWFVEGTYD
jgi:protein ImuB